MKSSHNLTVAIVAAAVALAAASVLAVAAVGGAFGHGRGWPAGSSCAVPSLPGTVVDATLVNMGGPMMRGQDGSMMGGMMRLSMDRSTVAVGQVTFLAVNAGNINHELVVLPLPADQIVGTRPIGADGKIDEAGSLGEASNSCAAGSGDGIAPGASSWVTVTLPAGRYEVVCNLAGHYAAGMYAPLTVS
jgi:uncharacterized cupredoxin-like copper-binding protein